MKENRIWKLYSLLSLYIHIRVNSRVQTSSNNYLNPREWFLDNIHAHKLESNQTVFNTKSCWWRNERGFQFNQILSKVLGHSTNIQFDNKLWDENSTLIVSVFFQFAKTFFGDILKVKSSNTLYAAHMLWFHQHHQINYSCHIFCGEWWIGVLVGFFYIM